MRVITTFLTQQQQYNHSQSHRHNKTATYYDHDLARLFFLLMIILLCTIEIHFATTKSASISLSVSARVTHSDKVQLSKLDAHSNVQLKMNRSGQNNNMHLSNKHKQLQLHLAEAATIQLVNRPTLKGVIIDEMHTENINKTKSKERMDKLNTIHEIPLKVFVNDIELNQSSQRISQNKTHHISMTTEALETAANGYFKGVVLLKIKGVWD